MTPAQSARIHLLPAFSSPVVVIIRRKPSQVFHIVRWNTQHDTLEQGSWFHGKLYPKRCDVSPDGKWMVYLAMGATAKTWNGICRVPFLKTEAEATSEGTWFGGGYWRDSKNLLLNGWGISKHRLPFQLGEMVPEYGGECLSVLYAKMKRDGWKRRGQNYGKDEEAKRRNNYTMPCDGDDGWSHQPSKKHPKLIAKYLGYLKHGYTLSYQLEDYPDLLDSEVDSACWDFKGNLIFSRKGIVALYRLEDLDLGVAHFSHNLEDLKPPFG